MSVNSPKQNLKQLNEWYVWFNKKYDRFSQISSKLKSPNKHNN